MAGSNPGHFVCWATRNTRAWLSAGAGKWPAGPLFRAIKIVNALFTTFEKPLFTKGFERSRS
jgi:hypothetical protein